MRSTKTTPAPEVLIEPIQTESIAVCILGTRPLIVSRVSEKAMRELLLPAGRKTTAEKAANLKHDPIAEYRAAPYLLPDPDAPTLLAMPTVAFKAAMMEAALDLPGARKAQIGRLVWVEGSMAPIYGQPEMLMSIVRSSDIARTPDVRTRAIVPEWAALLRISFAVPLLNPRSIVNLLAAAGRICGIGDWRQQKGKGSYGQFDVVDPEEPAFKDLIESTSRERQSEGLNNPQPYDRESEDLLAWFTETAAARGKTATALRRVG